MKKKEPYHSQQQSKKRKREKMICNVKWRKEKQTQQERMTVTKWGVQADGYANQTTKQL